MTDIDSAADIDIVWREHEVTVSIPLAGTSRRDGHAAMTSLWVPKRGVGC
jgi:hypothetical protein